MFDFFFSGWFWGLVLVMAATGSIIKNIFKIKFSLFLIFILIAVIFFIANLFSNKNSDSITYVATDEIIKINDVSGVKYFNFAFSPTTIDLTLMNVLPSEYEEIEINNLMGKLRILINKSQKIKIQSKTFFGSTKSPDEIKTTLGNNVFFTSKYSKANPHITINIETIFGSTEIYEK